MNDGQTPNARADAPVEGRADGVTRGRGRPSTLDRTAVLDAAWTVIAARGVDATRYADVAEASGTPVSTLQNAFGSLQALLVESIQHASDREDLFLTTIPGPDEADAESRLRALATGAVGPSFGVEAYLVWLELWRASARDTGLAEQSFTAYERWWDVAESIVEQGQREQVFTTAAPARDLAMTLVAILDGVALALLLPATRSQPDVAARVALTGMQRVLAP